MFNALKYTQELEHAGFSREQAETSMKILIEVMNENFATKADLKSELLATKTDLTSELLATKTELRSELLTTKTELKTEIDRLENKMQSGFTEIKSEMRELEYKLTIKLGVMLTVAVGATATMMKLFQAI